MKASFLGHTGVVQTLIEAKAQKEVCKIFYRVKDTKNKIDSLRSADSANNNILQETCINNFAEGATSETCRGCKEVCCSW